jgi:hypothetical protein
VPHSPGFGRRKDTRTREAVSIGDVVAKLLDEEVFSRGMPVAQLASHWPQIVGARLATETAPVSLEAGVLTVRASTGPWGAQARFLHEEIRRRADQALANEEVAVVRIVVSGG